MITSSAKGQEACTPKILSAFWNNWYGGIQNVGGVNYKVTLTNCKTISIDSMIVDDVRVQIWIEQNDSTMVVKGKESRTVKPDTVSPNPKETRMRMRMKPPESCTIYYTHNEHSTLLEVNSFTRGKDVFYQ
jgi:hypothetical protein